MTHPLQDQISSLRRRLRRLVFVHGLSCLIAVPLAAVSLVGLLDYVTYRTDSSLRVLFDDPTIRVVFWLAIVGLYAPQLRSRTRKATPRNTSIPPKRM